VADAGQDLVGGLGPDVGAWVVFQVSIQLRMSVLSWRTEVWVPRRFLVVNSANQPRNHHTCRFSFRVSSLDALFSPESPRVVHCCI
jgi:hypothetical protein